MASPAEGAPPDEEPPPVTGIIAAYLPNEAATIVDTIEEGRASELLLLKDLVVH